MIAERWIINSQAILATVPIVFPRIGGGEFDPQALGVIGSVSAVPGRTDGDTAVESATVAVDLSSAGFEQSERQYCKNSSSGIIPIPEVLSTCLSRTRHEAHLIAF